jgi:hypothetical protein
MNRLFPIGRRETRRGAGLFSAKPLLLETARYTSTAGAPSLPANRHIDCAPPRATDSPSLTAPDMNPPGPSISPKTGIVYSVHMMNVKRHVHGGT